MPLKRYFLYVGGVLLALLLVANLGLPELPAPASSGPQLPPVRIHSDRKLPERIVYDTSRPTIIPAPLAGAENQIPPAAADISANSRRAFAQLQPSDAGKLRSADPKTLQSRQQRLRRIARKHPSPRFHLVARQPQFDWFGSRFW